MRPGALLGRGGELDAIDAFLGRVASGSRALVVEGEPGIGKTSLLGEALDRARGGDRLVLAAGPVATETRLGFSVLTDLLEPVADELVPRLPEPQRRALEVALLRESPGSHRVDQRTIASATLSVLRELSGRGPFLVAIDDLQWVDGPSARVLEFAVRRLAGLPVGLIGCLRIEEGSDLPIDLERALGQDRVTRLRLGPLSLAALHELFAERLGRFYARPALVAIRQACGGNPLFALEIARMLPPSTDVPVLMPLPVPRDVRAVVHDRIDRLPGRARRALLLAAAASHPTAELIGPSIDAARATQLIGELRDGRIVFTHPLYASAVYEAAASDERRNAHRWLAERVDDVEERAGHLALATTAADAHVADELDLAASRARFRGAPEVSAQLEERALELTPIEDVARSHVRALTAADDWFHAGAPSRARSLLERTLGGTDDRRVRAEALRLLAQVRFREQSVPEAIELLYAAAEEADDVPELRAPIERDLVFALVSISFDLEAARPHADALIGYADRLADKALLAEALAAATMLAFLLGDGVDEERLARALALEDPDHRVSAEFRPSAIAGFLAFYTGRSDLARSLLYPLRTRLRERGAESDLPMLSGHLAWLECWAGAFGAARSLVEEAVDAASLAENEAMRAMALAQAALLEAHAGREEACRDRAAAAEDVAQRTGYGLAVMWSSASIAHLELSLDRPQAAYRALQPWIEFVERQGLREPIRAFFLADGIEALIAIGHLDRAERLTRLLLSRGRALDRPLAVATGRRCRAVLFASRGHPDAALREIGRALEEHARVPVSLELGRTLLAKAQIERRAKQKAAARESLERAADLFHGLGAGLWAERARTELARVGLRRPASDDLTETERRVAELAALGLRNREVAAQLFLSPKTVEANLARVYRKLHIRSRAELGARVTTIASKGDGRVGKRPIRP